MERDVKLVKRGKCRNLKLKQLCPEIKVKNKGSMENINFLGGPARVASDRYEYEKALCVQV